MGMEEDTKAFFILIAQTVSSMMLWMLVNVVFGIYFGFGLFEDKPRAVNFLYYFLAVLSLFFLIRHFKKRWKL